MRRRILTRWPIFVTAAVVAATSCAAPGPESEGSSTLAVEPAPTTEAPGPEAETQPPDPATVALRPSSVTWETYAYDLTPFNTILIGSYDGETRVKRTFDTWILENEYLEVTLLPEFGGRILSMIYKPTGHELLYQNPVGVPYQIDTGVFFHNWLMVYGGIFPTFPEPEHGKAWFLPWDFEVVEDTGRSITVAMSFVDDEDYPLAPSRYERSATGIEVTFLVTLAEGRAAVDTAVVIDNPGPDPVEFEYWTNATLAPGSEPGDTRTTAAAEIIAPVDTIVIPSFWANIASLEESTSLNDVYVFDTLRRFENWADRGIAYAFPDMRGANFWGVIDQDSREGVFRIADNTVTPGLKLWTWGFPQTADIDPYAAPLEDRPYIELWAGVTRQFFQKTTLDGFGQLQIAETYSPTVGLANVTHANEDFLVELSVGEDGTVRGEIFGINPGTVVVAAVTVDGDEIHQVELTLDPAAAALVRTSLPASGSFQTVGLTLRDPSGALVFTAEVAPQAE